MFEVSFLGLFAMAGGDYEWKTSDTYFLISILASLIGQWLLYTQAVRKNKALLHVIAWLVPVALIAPILVYTNI